jgi:hypothetical protein
MEDVSKTREICKEARKKVVQFGWETVKEDWNRVLK